MISGQRPVVAKLVISVRVDCGAELVTLWTMITRLYMHGVHVAVNILLGPRGFPTNTAEIVSLLRPFVTFLYLVFNSIFPTLARKQVQWTNIYFIESITEVGICFCADAQCGFSKHFWCCMFSDKYYRGSRGAAHDATQCARTSSSCS